MIRRLRGTIYHQRLNPLKHQFRYPAWYTVADLRQEQPFKSTHHLDRLDQPILDKLEALLKSGTSIWARLDAATAYLGSASTL